MYAYYMRLHTFSRTYKKIIKSNDLNAYICMALFQMTREVCEKLYHVKKKNLHILPTI